ncbi:uncharacterized protein BYT42DRAFT_344838 [Radiomyces spectabilis]|uniref:uncharacterized protein n=1 Tax=Radiomyces spectabilis TaxID=64574 RepID=UPI00221F4010|nr:uncharacterized protein BYT42DRAFT_344838 [Radiomyces spectabilis]KAI8377448.1 hypothetical protein BYT42DRAFT_344838 [Radiomyces spectabilis]
MSISRQTTLQWAFPLLQSCLAPTGPGKVYGRIHPVYSKAHCYISGFLQPGHLPLWPFFSRRLLRLTYNAHLAGPHTTPVLPSYALPMGKPCQKSGQLRKQMYHLRFGFSLTRFVCYAGVRRPRCTGPITMKARCLR